MQGGAEDILERTTEHAGAEVRSERSISITSVDLGLAQIDVKAKGREPGVHDNDCAHSAARGRFGSLRCEAFEQLWTKFSEEENPQILRTLQISEDGGLGEGSLSRLWATPEDKLKRVWGAFVVVSSVIGNLYFILKVDMQVLLRDTHSEKYLLGKEVWDLIALGVLHTGITLHGEQLVTLAELALLFLLMGRCLVLIQRALYASKECYRWQCVARLFGQWLPLFMTFSSMKLLHFVKPTVLVRELYMELAFTHDRIGRGQYFRAAWKLAWFSFFRIFCFLSGFDAFLVKLRVTARFANFEKFDLRGLVLVGVFMFQVLNIVNLGSFARARLFVFIFGGEDGVVATKEKAKEYLWNALLAKRLRDYYPLGLYLLIMLSLDDFDFQALMLKEIAQSSRIRRAHWSLPPSS